MVIPDWTNFDYVMDNIEDTQCITYEESIASSSLSSYCIHDFREMPFPWTFIRYQNLVEQASEVRPLHCIVYLDKSLLS